MGLIEMLKGVLRRETSVCAHTRFLRCHEEKCRAVYQLNWCTDSNMMFDKTDFAVRCIFCGNVTATDDFPSGVL